MIFSNSLFAMGLLVVALTSCTDNKKTVSTSNEFTSGEAEDKTYAFFDKKNNLIRPKDYRSWVFAGSAATPKSHDPKAGFPDFQNVYVDPVSYAYWKKYGKWREGTILVKELLRQGDTVSSVGRGFYQGAHFEVAAEVKDSKRFPDMNGGWNYFGFADFKKNKLNAISVPLGNQCADCHIKNAIEGDVFYQYYPVIKTAKKYGDGSPENDSTREGLVVDYKYKRELTAYMKALKK